MKAIQAVRDAFATASAAQAEVQQQQLNLTYQSLQRKLVESVGKQRELVNKIRRGNLSSLPEGLGRPLLRVRTK